MYQDGPEGDSAMTIAKNQLNELSELIARLDTDRSWLLEQIDRGNWPELRMDLAALERELGQLLTKIGDQMADQSE